MQFRVTNEEGTYLCVMRALVYEGSILVYNPTRDEVEWVPICDIANDLSHGKERSVVALANFVPCIPHKADHITELGARHLVGWSNDSSSEEEDDEPMEEEDGEPEGVNMKRPRDRKKQTPNHHPAMMGLSRVKPEKRLNHGSDNDGHRSWGLSWMRSNLSLSMTHGPTRMPPLAATPLHV